MIIDHGRRPACVADVHEFAVGMPFVTREGPTDRPVYQVGKKSFVYFRTPRPDAVDEITGEKYPDVIMFWVIDESDKLALVQDPNRPFFSTPHFDGHPSVLVRACRLGELSRAELAEIIEDAWVSRASAKRQRDWWASQQATR